MSATPGPWEVDEGGQLIGLGSVDGSPVVMGLLYGFDHPDGPLPEMVEDGRLIAAAPELLEACKAAYEFIQNGIEFGYIRMPDMEADSAKLTPELLRSAIAKARAG